MFIKRDRFLGKFKKGPPHIGEYEKKVHFGGGKSPMVNYYYANYRIQVHNTNTNTKIQNTKNTKIHLEKIRYFYIFGHFILY